MGRHLGIAAVDLGLVEAGLDDARLQVVGDDLTGNAAEEGEAMNMGADPVGEALAPGRLGVGIAGGAEDGDKDLGHAALAALGVDDLDGGPGVVDEHLLAGEMGLAHGRREAGFPGPMQIAEAAVAVAGGPGRPILLPQQRQG